MKNKIISFLLSFVVVFCICILPTQAESSATVPAFEINLISENESTVIVSVDLLSGSFRAVDFCLEVSDIISRCDSIKVVDGLDSACSVEELKVSAIEYNSYETVGELALFTLTKKSIRNINKNDIKLTVTACFSGSSVVTPYVVNNLPEKVVAEIPSFSLNVVSEGDNNIFIGLELIDGKIKELNVNFGNGDRVSECIDIYKGSALLDFEEECGTNEEDLPDFSANTSESKLTISSSNPIETTGYLAVFVFKKNTVRIVTSDEIFFEIPICVSDSSNIANQVVVRSKFPKPEVYGDEFIIVKEPEKTTYYKDIDTLDLTGASLWIYSSQDVWSDVEITDDMVSGFDNSQTGYQKIFVSYSGMTASFDIKVVYYVDEFWEYSIENDTGEILSYSGSDTDIAIPDGVDVFETTMIADDAFFNHSNMRSVKLPSTVKSVGASAFEGCSMLSTVMFPKGTETIGKKCFLNCSELNSAYIPATVTEIGYDAFKNVSSDFKIYGYKNTAAEEYAEEYGIPFVNLEKHALSIEVASLPLKTNYKVGECLNTQGMTLLVNYDNGQSETLESGFKCDKLVLTELGEQKIHVTYDGQKTSFSVYVDELQNGAVFAVSNAQARPGQTFDVTVSINDNPGLIATKININYDSEALTLNSVTDGTIMGSGNMVAGNDISKIPYTIIWEDSLAEKNYSDDGTLLTLSFTVKKEATSCKTPIVITYEQESTLNYDLDEVSFNVINAEIEIIERLAGDADKDGKVTLKDAVLIRRWLSNDWDIAINQSNADVNLDGIVSLKDVVLIKRFLVGGWGVELL